MKFRLPSLLQASFCAVVLGIATGCQTRGPAAKPQPPQKILDVSVSGYVDRNTAKQVAALKEAVASVDKVYPILAIHFIDGASAEVTTGIVRGPLNASGHFYLFRFRNGKWTTDRLTTGVWVS